MRAKQPHRVALGNAVRELRLERQWTQEHLAHKAGLHWTYIGGIERGERNVGVDNIIKIAKALGVPPGQLFKTIK